MCFSIELCVPTLFEKMCIHSSAIKGCNNIKQVFFFEKKGFILNQKKHFVRRFPDLFTTTVMATNVRSVNGNARDLPKVKLDAVEKQRCQDALATLWEILGREQAYLKSLAEKEAQKKVFAFFH